MLFKKRNRSNHVKSIKERLNEIKNDDLIMTDRALEELILTKVIILFPL